MNSLTFSQRTSGLLRCPNEACYNRLDYWHTTQTRQDTGSHSTCHLPTNDARHRLSKNKIYVRVCKIWFHCALMGSPAVHYVIHAYRVFLKHLPKQILSNYMHLKMGALGVNLTTQCQCTFHLYIYMDF